MLTMSRVESGDFRDWNERMVKRYDPDAFHHHPNPLIRFIERRRVGVIHQLLGLHRGERLLEVGCGAGNVLEKASGGRLFGIDMSTFVLVKAKQKLNGVAYLLQGDAQDLPFKSKVFSKIICSEVLEHLPDPSASLNEMKRVLDDRGIAIISVPNEFLINRVKRVLVYLRLFRCFNRSGGYRKMPERMEDEWHLHAFRIEEWLNIFEGTFKVTRLKGIPFFWVPLRYIIRLQKL